MSGRSSFLDAMPVLLRMSGTGPRDTFGPWLRDWPEFSDGY